MAVRKSRRAKKVMKDPSQRKRPIAKIKKMVMPDPPRDPVVDLMPPEVLEILDGLQMAQKNRRQLEVLSSLEAIQERISRSLEHFGISGNLKLSASEEEDIHKKVHGPPIFDAEEQKERLRQKGELIQRIARFLQSNSQYLHIVTELGDWFESNETLEPFVPTEAEMTEKLEEMFTGRWAFNEASQHTDEVMQRLEELGQRLLKEAGYCDSDDEDDMGGQRRRMSMPSFSVISHDGLLSKRSNFDTASGDIKLILDWGVRVVKTVQQKNVFRSGGKQFKNLQKATNQRLNELHECKTLNTALATKVDELEDANSSLRSECGDVEKNLRKLRMEVRELETRKDELEQENGALKDQVDTLEINLQTLEEELVDLELQLEGRGAGRSSSRVVTLAGASKSSLAKGSKNRMPGSRDSLGRPSQVKFSQDEIDELRNLLQLETEKSARLEKELLEEKAALERVLARLEVAESVSGTPADKAKDEMQVHLKSLHNENDTLERQITRLKAELKCKDELLEFQERKLSEMKDNVTTIDGGIEEMLKKADNKNIPPEAKRMFMKMEKQFKGSMSAMKDHADKERARSEAALRRLEQAHQEQLQNVHKQSIHLLRAINRFKGSIVQVLQRENLPAAANDVRNIPDLPTDAHGMETRWLLAQMAGNAVELLVSIEIKLSQALMNKRLEIKDNTMAKSFAAKDLELQTEVAHKAKLNSEQLAEKLKEVKQQLSASEEALKYIRKMEDERYSNLMNRYRKLWGQYNAMQKELIALKNDMAESIKKKDSSLASMLKQRRVTNKMVEEQQRIIAQLTDRLKKRKVEAEESLHMSLHDIHRSIFIVEQYMRQDKLSKETYQMLLDTLYRIKFLPLLRLRHLCNRYIVFRKLKHAQDELHDTTMKMNLGPIHEKNCKNYIEAITTTMEKSNDDWNIERTTCDTKVEEDFEQASEIFDTLIADNECLMISGKCNAKYSAQVPHPQDVVTEMTPPHLSNRRQGFLGDMMPASLVGTGVHLIDNGKHEELWKVPRVGPAPRPRPAIDTPQIMAMDVHSQMRQATKALRKGAKRSLVPVTQVEGCDYTDGMPTPLSQLLHRNSDLDIPGYNLSGFYRHNPSMEELESRRSRGFLPLNSHPSLPKIKQNYDQH